MTALARSEEKSDRLRALGAVPVIGDAAAPGDWLGKLRGASVLIDLAQPELPARIRPRDIEAVSDARQAMTRELLTCLRMLRTLLLLGFPAQRDALVRLASALTVSKFSLYFAALALALVGAIIGRSSSREVHRLDRIGGIPT